VIKIQIHKKKLGNKTKIYIEIEESKIYKINKSLVMKIQI